MKNIYKILCFVVLGTFLTACPKTDTPGPIPLRDRQEVYDENLATIEAYLQDNYLTVDANMDATITAIPEGGTQTSIWDQTIYPLQSIPVKNDTRISVFADGAGLDDVDYKLYYIVLNEGGGEAPISIDSTFTAYKGWNLSNEIFDQNIQGTWSTFPESSSSFISGYRQILSQVKTEASNIVNANGTITRTDFGNVIVFIPSGLAYFNNVISKVGQYSPICFQIKLFTKRERDHDGDRILSKFEDINGNGNYFDDDSDGDNVPDFFDVDDDGDGTLTKVEITKPTPLLPSDGPSLYYPYNAFTILDDPMTPEDESLLSEPKGIPDCTSPVSDYTTPTRVRKHLNPDCN